MLPNTLLKIGCDPAIQHRFILVGQDVCKACLLHFYSISNYIIADQMTYVFLVADPRRASRLTITHKSEYPIG